MAKIFLTVVGTGNYKPTKYRLNNSDYENRFVQKSLLKLLDESGEKFDKIVFFLTERARSSNWEQYIRVETLSSGEKISNTDEGLKPFLDEHFPNKYEAVDICDGQSEAEQLELFNTMYNSIGEGDEIVFDITHGFRFIPLLFFPLISYAKELKDITIKNIYYGLLNNDGDFSDIIDLKGYEEILNCANAAHNFRCSGNSAEIAELIGRIRGEKTVEEKIQLSGSDDISQTLKDLTYALLTCQGGDCAGAIPKKLNKLKNNKGKIAKEAISQAEIFNNIINHAIESVDELSKSETPYELGLNAVKWYMERGLYMQAYTALRECVTTFFCCTYSKNSDYLDKKLREKVDNAINSISSMEKDNLTKADFMRVAVNIFNDSEITNTLRKQYAITYVKIINHIEFEKISYFHDLRESRNCMNHFGMRKNSTFVEKGDIEKHYTQTIELFEDIKSRLNTIISDEEALQLLEDFCKGDGIFVNFSNHPLKNWGEEQISAAKEICGGGDIVDVPFPSVSADASEDEIKAIAKEYSEKIADMKPSAVMCMGEFGVCFKVVEYLNKRGIKTVYSCSERKAVETTTEKGIEKTSVFSFVKFREYNK